MKQIKFRVWNGEIMSEIFHPWEMKEDVTGGWIDSQGCGLWYPGCEAHNVVWMQFTGLKDKNGREIYEGDLILGATNKAFPVTFADGRFRAFSGQIEIGLHAWPLREVVGNIYENPELLPPVSP